MLSPAEALAEILAACVPLPGELVELSAAGGRVLLGPVVAERRLPPWDNSAMDGYAVRAAEVAPGKPLPVAGVVAAGSAAGQALRAGEALRIMTGAPLPEGADAVIMREEADEEGGQVRFRVQPAPGEHVRRAGEDVQLGAEVLPGGAPLGAGEIGLLAALGRTLLLVHRRPLVAILSTGDELVYADRRPGAGQIVGSNAHALAAQVAEAGGVPWVLPFAPDDRAQLSASFSAALRADAVLSTGGVSVGEFDYVKQVLGALGVSERFWQVAMKPGRPLSFGVLPPSLPVFGLPGNPASSMVSFELFVRPALRRMLGARGAELSRPLAPVRLTARLRPDPLRPHFLRARLERAADGSLEATPLSHQGSGMLRSMVGVGALLEIPPGAEPLPAGSVVRGHLLRLV